MTTNQEKAYAESDNHDFAQMKFLELRKAAKEKKTHVDAVSFAKYRIHFYNDSKLADSIVAVY